MKRTSTNPVLALCIAGALVFAPITATPSNTIAPEHDAHRLLRNPPTSLRGETDLACAAVTVYHEARGEPVQGQRNVAQVMLWRVHTPRRWGETICAVARPNQFSYLRPNLGFATIHDARAWHSAVWVAERELARGPNPEFEADHYHAAHVNPSWSGKMEMVARVGKHLFMVDPTARARRERAR